MTNKSKPGGRPRETRATHNAFGAWLQTCGMTPAKVARRIGVSVSSVYNMRNNYFLPGRELSNEIAKVSDGQVPASSWDVGDQRKRVARPKRGRKAK